MRIEYDFREIEAFRTLKDEEIRTMIERYILNDIRIKELIARGNFKAPSYVPMNYNKLIDFTTINPMYVVGRIESMELVSDTIISVDLKQTKENVIIKAINQECYLVNPHKRYSL